MWTETSTKRKARHSIVKELGLDRLAKLTPGKKKLYDRIRTLQLRKKYVTKNMREVFQLDNPLIQTLSFSLNVQTSRFLASVVRNSRHQCFLYVF